MPYNKLPSEIDEIGESKMIYNFYFSCTDKNSWAFVISYSRFDFKKFIFTKFHILSYPMDFSLFIEIPLLNNPGWLLPPQHK